MPGNTTSSSLIKSAQARQAKIRAQEDAEVAFNWDMSAQTYDDYLQYSNFLTQRAKTAPSSDAFTYQKKIVSANRSFTSNEIQRETQSVLEGRSSITDKKQIIQTLYQRAQNNGDMNLAQNLISQWDSLDVQEQNMQEAAAAAGERLSNAQEKYSKKMGAGYADLAQGLKNGLEDLTRAYNKGGQIEYNKTAKKFVDLHRGALKALGIDLPKDYSTNIGQVINGVVAGIGTYYEQAAQATALSAPESSQGYSAQADDILSGKTTFNTPAGNKNAYEIQDIADNPNLFIPSTDQNGKTTLIPSTVAGFQRDINGRIVSTPSGYADMPGGTPEQKKEEEQLKKLGFQNVKYNSSTGSYTVQLTNETSQWLKPENLGKTKNDIFEITPSKGGFQFKNDNRLFNIGIDQKGLAGLFEINTLGETKHIAGQYGFNQLGNTAIVNKQPVNWRAPMQPLTPVNSPVPVFNQKTISQQGDPLGVLGVINRGASSTPAAATGKPTMVQRSGGGFNYTDATGKSVSAYTYARLVGQTFRSVLSTAAAKGDTYSGQALKYAGNDGAYNPAQVDLGTAKNWSSLTWGNDIKLQTPQASRNVIPLFNR